MTAEVNGVGVKGSRDTSTVQVRVETLLEAFVEACQTLEFSSSAKVSGFSEDQQPD